VAALGTNPYGILFEVGVPLADPCEPTAEQAVKEPTTDATKVNVWANEMLRRTMETPLLFSNNMQGCKIRNSLGV
jgi:hypothetical protein